MDVAVCASLIVGAAVGWRGPCTGNTQTMRSSSVLHAMYYDYRVFLEQLHTISRRIKASTCLLWGVVCIGALVSAQFCTGSTFRVFKCLRMVKFLCSFQSITGAA